MKRTVRLALGAVIVLCIGIAVVWVAFPARTAAVLIKLNNMAAGLSEQRLSTEMGDIHYLEGGQGDTIVLVHGIYARKEHWVDLARDLVGDYHVIALDLPGFGDNETLTDDAYLLEQQRDNLAVVLDGLGLSKVHVGANSMGAYIAVLLAQDRPDLFASLAFIGSPLGVPTQTQSDMDKARAQGHRPLVVKTNADFHARHEWLSPNMPYLPGPILKSWMANEVAMADKNARIWDVVHTQSDVPSVLALAPGLDMETLIVWCQPDRIFHVSGADALARAFQRAVLVTPDGCGHLPMLDRTDVVAAAYTAFLADIATPAASR